MRKLIYGINLTADGCCDHTKGVANEQIHKYFAELMRGVDLIIYGRKTYELMVPYWPDVAQRKSGTASEIEFAEMFTSIDKIVASRSLRHIEGNTRIIGENLVDEIIKLKQQEGGNISVGGIEVPSQLIAHGLVDEFHMVVHPVFAGRGRRLFDDIDFEGQPDLKLVDSKVLGSKFIALHYLKA